MRGSGRASIAAAGADWSRSGIATAKLCFAMTRTSLHSAAAATTTTATASTAATSTRDSGNGAGLFWRFLGPGDLALAIFIDNRKPALRINHAGRLRRNQIARIGNHRCDIVLRR